MTKLITGLTTLALFICACTDKKNPTESATKFTSFEIGYTNGWAKGISFWVDSNKIFFSPQKDDIVKYGLLPDSIVNLIDKTLTEIMSDKTIKSRDRGCVDCSIVALQAVIGNDTISIHQVGDIDKVIWQVIKPLQLFIDSSKHSTIHSVLFLETQNIVFPPPLPPLPNGRKFLPPKSGS